MNKSILCLALLLAISLTACGKSNTTPSPSPTTSAAASPATSPSATTSGGGAATVDAQSVFKANCMACHGASLEGSVGPNLQKVGGKLSKDQIVTTITNGRGAMPSFKGKLSDSEVGSLAAWLADKK
ncbi:c-type cytochrome [Paenibacillus sp. GCM10027628]|uniref:c-type cytochrome n=1 Tax=Paenibacillus sp. GCM10027628 TaxID=3273413 RepID=UPI003630B53F